jgi:hypothetical protein
MALLYAATLTPSKMELLSAWVPAQPWLRGATTSTLTSVGAYRFDDPAGEVGIETHLLAAAGAAVLQVPVTYRAGPLAGAEAALLGTTHHSVLGKRWVYDACADPVFAAALAAAVLTGGTQAHLDVVTDSGVRRRDPTTRVSGSGSAGTAPPAVLAVTPTTAGTTTIIRAPDLELVVLHVLDPHRTARWVGRSPILTGTWPGQVSPTLLAVARTWT